MSEHLKQTAPIILIGMHRSGTSMLTRQLHSCGVHMGKDLSVNAESKYFQELNRRLLAEAGGDWWNVRPVVQKMFADTFVWQQAAWLETEVLKDGSIWSFLGWNQRARLWMGRNIGSWGWKDPRNSITLPVWQFLFPAAKVIHVIRNGIDVAISLHRRQFKYHMNSRDYNQRCNDFEYCFRLWEQYVQTCFLHKQRLTSDYYFEVRYEDILQNPKQNMQSLLSFVGHEVSNDRLEKISQDVHSERLDNSKNRKQYQVSIEHLPASSFMTQLGYE